MYMLFRDLGDFDRCLFTPVSTVFLMLLQAWSQAVVLFNSTATNTNKKKNYQKKKLTS